MVSQDTVQLKIQPKKTVGGTRSTFTKSVIESGERIATGINFE